MLAVRVAIAVGIIIIAPAVAVALLQPSTGPVQAFPGENSIVTVDTVGTGSPYPSHTSIELDSSGNPVISYWDVTDDDLKVAVCGDPNCSSGNTIVSPDTVGDVGRYSSLELDASGNPVVSYYDDSEGDLKVLHCGNPTCTAGNSITSPDTFGDVGEYTSLALDASGNPVVSYYYYSDHDLRVLHCNDPDCADGDESITTPDTQDWVGAGTSLALDSAGNPVVAYRDATNLTLKVLHCNDPDCAPGGDTIVTPCGTIGDYGISPSIALRASDKPVVSHRRGGVGGGSTGCFAAMLAAHLASPAGPSVGSAPAATRHSV